METLICIRHGEKPANGLGQLSCQGLNRALALARVLLAKYGKPQFVFASNPAQTIAEYAGVYNYVRPLATIEPTAIYCGLPVNTQFGFPQIAELEAELQKEAYQNATIFYRLGAYSARHFCLRYGEVPWRRPGPVPPALRPNDYDTIFVIRSPVTKVMNRLFSRSTMRD